MKQTKRQLLAASVAAMMLVSQFGVVSYAEGDSGAAVAPATTASVANLTDLQTALADSNITEITITAVITITSDTTLTAANPVTITTKGVTDVLTVTSGALTLGKNLTISSDTSVLYATGTGIININGATINSTCTWYDLCYADNSGVINITDGILTNGTNIIGAIDNSEVTVSGGTLTSTGVNGVIYAKNNANVAVKEDAVLNCEKGIGIFVNPNDGAPTVSVTGGAITANKALQAYAGDIEISGGTLTGTTAAVAGDTASITITGGTFSDDVSDYIDENSNAGTVTDEYGNTIVTTCQHTATEFKFDADYHWENCTSCGGVEINKTAHQADTVWASADGKHYNACVNENCEAKLNEADCAGGTATCLAKAKCATCGGEYGETAEHKPAAEWTTADGKHYHVCATDTCTAKLDEAACTYGEGVETTAPTATTTGVMTYTCTVCKGTKTEEIPVVKPAEPEVYNLTASSFTYNTVITQSKKVVAEDGTETTAYRFIKKIKEDEAAKYSKATVAITDSKGTTKSVEINKCYKTIVASGAKVSEAGYVYVAYTVTEVPEGITLSATITLS